MHFTSESRIDACVVERDFTLDEIPGVLWTPETTSAPVPLILLGQSRRTFTMYPRLASRARRAAADGFATATIELPGAGDRPRMTAVDGARADLRRTLTAGEPVDNLGADRLVLRRVEQAVPEWQAALDSLLTLPEIGGPVGYSGGVISIGVRLAVVEPRIVAAGFFAGSFIPRSIVEEARLVTIPLHVLLQWNDRRAALELFDSFGSQEKTLQANIGGHTGVPAFAAEDTARFFTRHLRWPTAWRDGSIADLSVAFEDAPPGC